MTLGDSAIILASVLFGIWGFYGAVAFRRGRLRKMARWYFDRQQPTYFRNLPFYLPMTGVLGSLGAVTIVLDSLEYPWAKVVAQVAAVGCAVALIVGFAWVSKPPKFLKPAWLLAAEAEAEAR